MSKPHNIFDIDKRLESRQNLSTSSPLVIEPTDTTSSNTTKSPSSLYPSLTFKSSPKLTLPAKFPLPALKFSPIETSYP